MYSDLFMWHLCGYISHLHLHIHMCAQNGFFVCVNMYTVYTRMCSHMCMRFFSIKHNYETTSYLEVDALISGKPITISHFQFHHLAIFFSAEYSPLSVLPCDQRQPAYNQAETSDNHHLWIINMRQSQTMSQPFSTCIHQAWLALKPISLTIH